MGPDSDDARTASETPEATDRFGTFARASGIASVIASFLLWGMIPTGYVAKRWGGPSLVEATVITMALVWSVSYVLAMGSGLVLSRRATIRRGRRDLRPLAWAFASNLNFGLQAILIAALFLSGWLPR